MIYESTEAAYQASKVQCPSIRLLVSKMEPAEAKRYARHIALRPDWEQVKEKVMLDVVRLKFQIPELRDKLLATGDALLIEGNNWNDTFWGICKGQGQNKLGKILMQVRDELRLAGEKKVGK